MKIVRELYYGNIQGGLDETRSLRGNCDLDPELELVAITLKAAIP